MSRVGKRLCLSIVIIVSVLLAGCGATPIETVEPSLAGTWRGECEINLPVVFDPTQLPDGVERTQRTLAVELTIHENAAVDGTVGEATIKDSVLKRNRGEVGRRLNMASDYIITDGFLVGPLVSGVDDNDIKSFTIPFNLVDNRIQSWIMWKEAWKYPYPLCMFDVEQRR